MWACRDRTRRAGAWGPDCRTRWVTSGGMGSTEQVLRPHAGVEYASELAGVAAVDDRERPPNWRLSPWAVVTYLLGGELADGTVISSVKKIIKDNSGYDLKQLFIL